MVSAAVPFPPHGGGRMRTHELCRAMASEHDVSMLAFSFDGEFYREPDFEIDLEMVPWEPPQEWAALHGPDADAAVEAYRELDEVRVEPWFVSFYDSDEMRARVSARSGTYDLVLFEGTDMALFLDQTDEVIRVLDFMDLHSAMASRDARSAGDADGPRLRAEAERTLVFERRAATRCSWCLAVSDEEEAAARSLLGIEDIIVVPNGVNPDYFGTIEEEAGEPGGILFMGSFDYGPNVEAMTWFVRDVLPTVCAARPEATFEIIGRSPPESLRALDSPHVRVHGSVPDVRPHLSRAEIVVVPLLGGGGTKLKTLEALAAGRAVVSTSIGVEGLDLAGGQEVVVVDDSRGFATALIDLLTDADKRRSLARRGRAAAARHDWAKATKPLLDALRRVPTK